MKSGIVMALVTVFGGWAFAGTTQVGSAGGADRPNTGAKVYSGGIFHNGCKTTVMNQINLEDYGYQGFHDLNREDAQAMVKGLTAKGYVIDPSESRMMVDQYMENSHLQVEIRYVNVC